MSKQQIIGARLVAAFGLLLSLGVGSLQAQPGGFGGGNQAALNAEAAKAPTDFLEQGLIARTQKSPAKWDMYITIGQPGDAETDPSQLWPADREKVKVGTLAITQAMAQKDGSCGPINFDPIVVADGIQITDDPVLKARSAAYAVSFGKRMSGQ